VLLLLPLSLLLVVWCRAAAVLSMCLAEHFRDARPSAYAVQVAVLLQHDRSSVQQHIKNIEQHLLPLLPLLPFATPSGSNASFECVKYAGTLLKLQHLSQQAGDDSNHGPA